MNWNSDKSISLSQVCVVLFSVLLLTVDIGVWSFTELYERMGFISAAQSTAIKVTVYLGSVPAWTVLWKLWRLLLNIKAGEVFTAANVSMLRTVSWCCVMAAAVCFFGGLYDLAFLVIAGAAGFMALIVRIVKNVFQQALLMKDELDFTV